MESKKVIKIEDRKLSLTVIIPQYNEKESEVIELLDSINMQRGISFEDIRVLMINDSNPSGRISDEIINRYKKLNIKYLTTPKNAGPGQTRQFGIDNCETDYLIFADADDGFYSCDVFTKIYGVIEQYKAENKVLDIIYSKWIEELLTDNAYVQIPHTPDATWVHGKVFRTKYLTDNNIRFNPKIRLHEDSYFNIIAQMNTQNVASIDDYTYYWKWNENSLTRQTKYKYHYLVDTVDDLVVSIDDAMEQLINRNTKGREEYVVKGIFFMYYILQAPYWNKTDDKELMERRYIFERNIYNLIMKYNDAFRIPQETLFKYKGEERAQCLQNTGFLDEVETWEQFVKRLRQTFDPKPGANNCTNCKHFIDSTTKCPFAGICESTIGEDNILSTPTNWEAK